MTTEQTTPEGVAAPVVGILNEVTESASGITTQVVKGPITVDKIYESQYQKEKTRTAQLRQIVTIYTKYPSARISNNMQDNLFAIDDFGFDMREFESVENRVAFIDVPLTATIPSVEKLLEAVPQAVIYKVLSNHPILTDNQLRAIEVGLTTKDIIANGQAIRYSQNSMDKDDNDVSGQLIKRLDKVQYRSVFFKKEATADIDYRNADPDDMYLTAEISAELLGAPHEPSQHIGSQPPIKEGAAAESV